MSLENLKRLGAIEIKKEYLLNDKEESKLTELGKILAYIPLSPRYSKLLLLSRSKEISGYGLLIVSALSVEEIYIKNDDFNSKFSILLIINLIYIIKKIILIFIKDYNEEESEKDNFKNEIEFIDKLKIEKKKKVDEFRKKYNDFQLDHSDLFTIMNIIGFFLEKVIQVNDLILLDKLILDYSQNHNLISKSLKEIYYNFTQLLSIFETLISDDNEKKVNKLF